MAGVTYKCPSCGASLEFNPATQKWKCGFCNAEFTEEDLLPKAKEFAEKEGKEAQPSDSSGDDSGTKNDVIYNCPNCGSQIMTDETTVATHCYYCDSPVVLQGKLTAAMTPDQVLPFLVDKKTAVDTFMNWVKKKRFVPKDFFSREGMEGLNGVYYPHFVTQCEIDGSFNGEGQNISRMETPREVVTKTDFYSFTRQADILFRNVMRPALKSTNRKLSDGIHPFPLENAKPFSSAYLSGFLAERRDIDASEITEDVRTELTGYVKPILSETLNYNAYSGQTSAKLVSQKADYVLLPTWVLTYKGKKAPDGTPYYYIMNGCTGTICGKLPIDKGRLLRFGLIVGGLVFAAACVASYLFW